MYFFLILFFVSLGTSRYAEDVPLFVWSGESAIASRNQQIRGYYSAESVSELVKDFWKDGERRGLSHLVKPDHIELVVLLVNSALGSEDFSLHHQFVPTLAETMATHPSFYVPYVDAKESSLSALWKACRNAEKSGATAYFMGPESVIPHFEKHPVTPIKAFSSIVPAFANGKTDVVVVYLDEVSTDDKMSLIERTVQELMNTFTSEKFTSYVVALTSVDSSLESSLPSNRQMGVPEDVKRAILTEAPIPPNNGTYPPTIYNGRNTFNVYFNGVFWELFFVLLIFWTIVALGLRQLLQVQAPDRIPTLNAIKKKNK